MPIGRPRKIKVEETVEKNMEVVETAGTTAKEEKIPAIEERKKPAQNVGKNIPSAKDTRPTCQCCGKKIDSSIRTLNLTYLTSIAPYRFEVENENGLVKVCGECALELGKAIEMWMIEKGAKKKWSDL